MMESTDEKMTLENGSREENDDGGQQTEAVGIIFGTVGSNEFRFLVSGRVEKTDYVKAHHEDYGEVLGQVMKIERKTDLSMDKASLILEGGDVEIDEKVPALVRVIGYRDERGILQVPRTPFRAGEQVFKADDRLIKEVIGLKDYTETGAYIGLLKGHDIRVEIDINSMVQKHLSVLAKTGAGKSYITGVIIEELMKHHATVVIIDPHGEYNSMKHEGKVSNNTTRDFGVTPRSYADVIKEFATDLTINPEAEPLKFTLRNMTARDLLELTRIKSDRKANNALKKAMEMLMTANPNFAISDIIRVLEADEENNNSALIAELEYLDDSGIFARRGTKITEIVNEGKTSIINLKGTPPEIQELIVNRIATAFFELRKANKIPPLMMIVEEAHNYCPQQGQVATSRIMRTIAGEGRKFGLGLGIISQRPAKVDKNVLSQCNTQIILKVTNPLDLKAITSSVEGLTGNMEEEIQTLPIGTALVIGGNISMPLFVEVRPRETKHGGESVEIIPTTRV